MAEVTINDMELRDWLRNAERELPRAVSNKIKRTVVTEATKHFERQLRAQTPHFDTGTIKRSITRVVRNYRTRGRRGARGPDRYFLGVVGPSLRTGPHAHLIEFGTDERYTTGAGSAFRLETDHHGILRARGLYRGRMPAMPFFEAIFDAAAPGGRSIIENLLARELGREYQRIADGIRVQGGE